MTVRSFDDESGPGRVIFGAGTISRVATELVRLGSVRALVLSTPGQAALGSRVAGLLGATSAGLFAGAVMHTPVGVTEVALARAAELGADAIVSVGGGSTTGLGKAVAFRAHLRHLVLPTTYAGSEVTPVLGETADGAKTTRSGPEIVPDTVIYDVELTLTLPWSVTLTSAVNAMAHAVEALYAPDRTVETDGRAAAAITALAAGLRTVQIAPDDLDGRAELLYGAWLAGRCLAEVGMGLHHKLCHTLGGSFGLPHAPTHTVVLPYAMEYNSTAAPGAMAKVATALGVDDAPSGMQSFIAGLGGPTDLGSLGFSAEDTRRAAELATAMPYPNPREVTRDGIAGLLTRAAAGARILGGTAPGAVPATEALTSEVVKSFARAPERLRALTQSLVGHLHAFVLENDLTQDEWGFAIDFLTRTGHITTDVRQEFVLLSDTLGISSLVDILTNSRTPESTPSAVLGPFYVDGPPELEHGSDLSGGDVNGELVYADLTVTDGAGVVIPGAVVDVWQANEAGFYDVQLPDLDGPVLRGRFRTDAAGRLNFWTILPAPYPIPSDGPVGQLLGAVGRHPMRAPHLHVMIAAPACRTLITQLFVEGGDYLDSDTVFGVKEQIIVPYTPQAVPAPDGAPGRAAEGWRLLHFTFHLAGGSA